jgi:hypothetical protein
VQTKKRKMNIGEALVGMNRSGSQLWGPLAGANKAFGEKFKQTFLSRTSCPVFPRHCGRRSRLCCHPVGVDDRREGETPVVREQTSKAAGRQ